MTDQNEGTNETPRSVVLVNFSEPGSVVFSAHFEGVTPMQLLALAAYLELKGKNGIIQMENERAQVEAQNSIARPKLVLPGQEHLQR